MGHMLDINVYMYEQVGWDIRSRVGGVRIMNVLRMADVCINCKLKINFQRCMVGEVLIYLPTGVMHMASQLYSRYIFGNQSILIH